MFIQAGLSAIGLFPDKGWTDECGRIHESGTRHGTFQDVEIVT